MKYRPLGKYGLKLSAVGLGSHLTIGQRLDLSESRRMVSMAYEAGVNFFDTANVYGQGRAEEALGHCLADLPRSDVVVVSKVYWPVGPGPNARGLSAKHIREQCEASLRRLRMEYLDIYLCHRPDPETPLEETARAMEDLARAGKILYWGVSEWSGDLIAEADSVCSQIGARPIACSQPRYSLLYRKPESLLFPMTERLGVGNVVFEALAHGILTGKHPPGRPPMEGTRVGDPELNRDLMTPLYSTDANKLRAQQLKRVAADVGQSATSLALAWCLRHSAVTSVILGCSRPEQLQENVAAVDVLLDDCVIDTLDSIFAHPA